jgi:predicted transcriptional regulator
MHIAILKALADHGSLKPTHIMNETHINGHLLKQQLTFLTRHNLVDVQPVQKNDAKRVVYTITARGLNVLNYMRELEVILRIIKETPSQSNQRATIPG